MSLDEVIQLMWKNNIESTALYFQLAIDKMALKQDN
jgi:hypothetical protein